MEPLSGDLDQHHYCPDSDLFRTALPADAELAQPHAVTSSGRRVVVVVTVAAAMSLFVGCAEAPGLDPLGPQRREQIRQSILDIHWADIVKDYPDALRPEVPAMRPVSDHDQRATVIACLRANGIPASPTDNGFRYKSSLGQSQLEFEAQQYVCEASSPSESEVMSYLGARPRAALFDYQRKIVRPCLLAAGAQSPAPPDGGPAYYLSAARAAWNPYMEILAAQPRSSSVAYFEQRCPPLPPWFTLSTPLTSGASPR